MATPPPDPRVDPVRAAIDSTAMLVLARFFMPAVVAVLGWLLGAVLDDLKHNNARMQGQLGRLTEQQSIIGAASASATAKLDATIKQLDRLQGEVDGLARRN